MKRNIGEPYQAYCARRKLTNMMQLEHRLRRGYPFWTSCYLMSGEQMVMEWLQKHPGAAESEVEQVRKHFPKDKLFKVKAQGTYRRKSKVREVPQSTPHDPIVIAALKKCRRKKLKAEARRLTKLAERQA